MQTYTNIFKSALVYLKNTESYVSRKKHKQKNKTYFSQIEWIIRKLLSLL